MTYIPQTVSDNAQAQLSGAINASSTTILLKTGEGSDFPSTINGIATSTGDNNTLNSTGIQAAGVVVGDFIYNFTQGAAAMVTSVSANSVTTTDLYKTDRTKATWTASDAWYIRPFVGTLTNWSGTAFDGDPTKMEKVLILSRSTDVLNCVTSANRGYSGTTPQSFAPDDYITLFVEKESFFNTWIALGLLFEKKADDDEVVHLAGTETITGTKTFSTPPTASVAASSPNELMRKTDVELLITDSIQLEFYEDINKGFPYYIYNDSGTPKARKIQVSDSGFTASQNLANNISSSNDLVQDPSTGVYLLAYTDITVSPTEYNILPFTIDSSGAYTIGTKLKVGGDSTAALAQNMTNPYLCVDPVKGKVVVIGEDYNTTDTYISYITTTNPVGGTPTATRDTPTSINSSPSDALRIVYHKSLDKFVCITSTLELLISVDRSTDTWTAANGTNWTAAERPEYLIYDENQDQILYSYTRYSSPNHFVEIGRVEISGTTITSNTTTQVATTTTNLYGRIFQDPSSLKIAVVSTTNASGLIEAFMVTNTGTGSLSIDSGTTIQSTSSNFRSWSSDFDLINNAIHVSYNTNSYRKVDISSGSPVVGSQKTGVISDRVYQSGYLFELDFASPALIYRQDFTTEGKYRGVTSEAKLAGETGGCYTLYARADIYSDLVIGSTYYFSNSGIIPYNTGSVAGIAYTKTTLLVTPTE